LAPIYSSIWNRCAAPDCTRSSTTNSIARGSSRGARDRSRWRSNGTIECMMLRKIVLPLALCALAAGGATSDAGNAASAAARFDVTVASASGPHVFHVDQAKTADEQERGLMYRTGLADDYGK